MVDAGQQIPNNKATSTAHKYKHINSNKFVHGITLHQISFRSFLMQFLVAQFIKRSILLYSRIRL